MYMIPAKHREIRERKLVRNESFPEDIDGRLTAVLSSVNTEPKQVQLLVLNDEPKTVSMIKREFDRLTSGNFDASPDVHGHYCRETFVPIGLVCEESIIFTDKNRPVRAWSINDDGKHYAWPIAAFTLKKANEYGKSFYEILGPTHSRGDSRSPYNRFMIIDMLSISPMGFSDLSEFLKVSPSSIKLHIEELKKCGFVDFESISSEETGWRKYAWVKGKPEDVKKYKTQPSLTRRVADELYRHKESDCDELSKALKYSDKATIGGVLAHLEKEGFAKCLSRFELCVKLSEANLTDSGRHFHEDFVKILSDAFNPEKRALDYMRNIYDAYMKDREMLIEHATNGTSMYRGVSHHKDSTCFDDRCKEVYEAIRTSGGMRPKDIDKEMGTITQLYLSALLESGKIYKEKRGHATFYRATATDTFVK